jgi:hypothetical protein
MWDSSLDIIRKKINTKKNVASCLFHHCIGHSNFVKYTWCLQNKNNFEFTNSLTISLLLGFTPQKNQTRIFFIHKLHKEPHN